MWQVPSFVVVIATAAIGLAFTILVLCVFRAKKSLAVRTQAFAAVCHDLLTPLTRLRLRTERANETLRVGMMRDIDRMDRMLREMLDSFAHESKGHFEDIDLVSLLRTICSEFTDTGHTVTYDGPERMTIRARATALARAITNLVDNATKHGTIVQVRLYELKRTVDVEIADDGPGIPEHERKKVFDPFYTAHPHDAGQGRRFGLGLSVARSITEGHGGTLALHGRSPRGLVARLSLPRTLIVRR